MPLKHNLIDVIHSRGRRLTHQRQLVLDILEESQEHLDADTIYKRAKERDAQIGIATVYRTLAFLKELDLVDEHQFGENHSHFEAAQNNGPHYHFTCIKCKRVVEFKSPQVMEMVHKLCASEGLQIVEVHLYLSGYCAQCRSAETGCE